MAMTATISVTPSTVNAGSPVSVALIVSNSGGAGVNVTSIAPVITPVNAPAAVGSSPVATGASLVPAGGSRGFQFTVVPFGPTNAGVASYTVGAVVMSDDGSIFEPTAATVTVNGPEF